MNLSLKQLRRRFRLHQRHLEGRVRRRILGDHVSAAIMRHGDFVYAVDIEDQVLRRGRSPYRSSVQEEIDRARGLVDRDGNILVVGAHIGTVAIPLARCCKELWAIEANPRTFELLQLNIKLNGATNIRALNILAGERAEEIEFVLNRTNSGGSKRMPKVKAPIYFYDHPAVVKLTTQSLDAALPDTRFSLVFMDLEGSEYFALKGMRRILRDATVLMVEFLPHHLRDVSGVSPEEFTEQIGPGFDTLFIPSKNSRVTRPNFKPTLRAMYDRDEGDPGLVFTR